MDEKFKLDDLDQKLAENFPGRIVKKDYVRKMKSGMNIPIYVLEYLLGKYCSSTDPQIVEEGLNYVKDNLSKHYCRADESEKIKSYIKENKSKFTQTQIDILIRLANTKKAKLREEGMMINE